MEKAIGCDGLRRGKVRFVKINVEGETYSKLIFGISMSNTFFLKRSVPDSFDLSKAVFLQLLMNR